MAPRALLGSRPAALAVGVAMLGARPSAWASPYEPLPIEETTPADPTTDDAQALEVAQAAFAVGLEAYRAGDYARAVESWDSAHRLLVLAVDDTQMQRVLGFDLAQALLRLHANDRAPRHFDRARMLLEDYILWIERPGHAITEPEQVDLDHAKELLAIVEIDAAAEISKRHADPLPPMSSPSPYPRTERAPAPPAPVPIRQLRREMRTYLWLGAGAGATSVAFAAMAAALGASKRQFGELSTAGAGALAATATLSAIMAIVGIGAISVGLVRRKAVLRASPTLSRNRVGLVAEVAF